MTIFTGILPRRPKLNKFNLSHEHKLSCNMGQLIPMMCQEILLGDRFRVNAEILMRLSPMIAPMMHRVNVYTHFFFVPNRLVWNEWEDFITGGKDGSLAPAYPTMPMNTSNRSSWKKGRVADYFGIPPIEGATVAQSVSVSGLPFRAYQTIYNEYFRDQNLTDPVDFDLGGGRITDVDITTLTEIRQRAWEKDYFTSALPWSQRTNQEVSIPVQYKQTSEVYKDDGTVPSSLDPLISTNQGSYGELQNQTAREPLRIENIEGINIEDLRQSARLQEWLERTARGGARYIEQILAHFGVVSPDARLQRPEYLGGGVNPVVVSEVLNTAGDTGATEPLPQGNMAGHGISVGNTNRWKRKFTEHGYVIGVMSVLPKTAYQNNIERHFSRTDKLDYYWPDFAQLGEQEVKNKEVFWNENFDDGTYDEAFGYQSRYAEYKYACSKVSGDFRDTLSYWHMGRQFIGKPVLNESFVMSDPTQRIYAVTDPQEHKLYVQIYNSVSALRPIPYHHIPKL